ncbi:winged helix-turn-helix domain-containing protein [Vibrio europaeus]|uniref:CadC family transcriptional regulator n=1 Tax=Vibrio europaeus TaxID=300876 RepID=A0AAE7B029_9VIBR|nr:winged helix-turn-helix domain-containing protein [Vibrio europaeus]MDC5721829.1 winged helix-turn-helix domain-containing protein [Vibrio europaeus]MDC5758216.1 winged helix-turn-helix domain-containing protein [Vibrio europaeus]MDC5776493.1 winged helix-turn-helix domain-containing protein [Vibrio europaeus]MDC5795648.1 winged helix-turn-helix domain-containing protein [Vibrio europaeus]MDC5801591.1 winged helix-turn-helix domain-containing protein [Vibrio europaeus]
MYDIECRKISCAFCREVQAIEHVLGISVRSCEGKLFIVLGEKRMGCSQNAVRALCYFCQKKDYLVSKSDIEAYVWQGGVVGMSSLPVLMHEVRRLIRHSRFEIVTIRNKGFVFHDAKQKRLLEQSRVIHQQAVNT